jgi:hypothetical protein
VETVTVIGSSQESVKLIFLKQSQDERFTNFDDQLRRSVPWRIGSI